MVKPFFSQKSDIAMMMQGDPADKPRVKAQAYSDEQMEEHKRGIGGVYLQAL